MSALVYPEDDPRFDPTGGDLPESSLTTQDQAPDPPQTPRDLARDDEEGSDE